MAGAIKVINPRNAAPRALQAGPPNMHLLGLQKAAQRGKHDRWEQIQRNFQPTPLNGWEAFPARPEWAATTRLLFEAAGFDFNGPPPRRARPTMRLSGDPETVVNVRELLDQEEETEEPLSLSFDPGPIVWDELDTIAPTAGTTSQVERLALSLELYEPPEPELRGDSTPTPAPKPVVVIDAAPLAEPHAALEHLLLAPDDDYSESTAALDAPAEVPAPPVPPVADQPAPLDDIQATALAPEPEHEAPPLRPLELPPPALSAEPLVPSAGNRLHMPALSIEPLRPRLVRDAPPAPPAPVEPEPAAKAELPEPPAAETPVVVRPLPEPVIEVPEPQPEPQPPPAATRENPSSRPNGKKKKKNRGTATENPIEEPTELGEDVEAGLKAPAPDATPIAPAPTPTPALRPASPAPAVRSSSVTSLHLTPAVETPAPVQEAELPSFGNVSTPEVVTHSASLKAGLALAALAVIGGGLYLFLGTAASTPAGKAPATGAGGTSVATAGLVTGEAGWSTDYATDATGRRLRQISFYRPTQTVIDYRVEFQGEVEYKALSWVMRGANTKSYYVLKIVPDKGNVARLLRFPVIDGKPGATVTKDLPFPASLGMTYRVLADVAGSQFSVTIQDKKIDQWSESNLPTGGFGVANEGSERGQIRNVQVWHLRQVAAR